MGIIAALLSAVLSSSKDFVSKHISGEVDGTTSAFASFAYALPYYGALLIITHLLGGDAFVLSKTVLLLVFLRSLTDTFAELMKMHAFSHGDISLVACIFALYPLFLLITSPIITGDPISSSGVVAIVLIVSGSIILLWRPGTSRRSSEKKAILFAFGASICFSLNSCFDRLAVQHAPPIFSGFAMTLLSALFLLPFIARVPGRWAMVYGNYRAFFLRGFFEVGFMVLKLYALQFLQAPYVVGLQKISVLISVIGGKVLFKEEDFRRRLLAGALVFSGIITIVIAG